MNVLIAGETSGKIRETFRKRGHNAWSVDLLPAFENSNYHIQGDMFAAINSRCWDLLIAHPDCTYLTSSAEWAYADTPMINGKPRNIKPGTLIGARRRAARELALQVVRDLMSAPIKKKVIENPVGQINTQIYKPNQYIQPYQFGHDASKKTGLWLFNVPPLFIPPENTWIAPRIVQGLKRWGNQTDSGQNKLAPSKNRWQIRSETYQGWADAMAENWG